MMTEADSTSPTPESDLKAANRARFELELEFVQSLANPFYLHSLAQQNLLDQPAFINFLEYLLYWKEKDYARFIQCVWFLYSVFPVIKCWKTVIPMLFTILSFSSTHNSDQRWKRMSGENISIRNSLTIGERGKFLKHLSLRCYSLRPFFG